MILFSHLLNYSTMYIYTHYKMDSLVCHKFLPPLIFDLCQGLPSSVDSSTFQSPSLEKLPMEKAKNDNLHFIKQLALLAHSSYTSNGLVSLLRKKNKETGKNRMWYLRTLFQEMPCHPCLIPLFSYKQFYACFTEKIIS